MGWEGLQVQRRNVWARREVDLLEPSNHGMVGLKGTLKPPSPNPCLGLVAPHQIRLPRAPSNPSLGTSREKKNLPKALQTEERGKISQRKKKLPIGIAVPFGERLICDHRPCFLRRTRG